MPVPSTLSLAARLAAALASAALAFAAAAQSSPPLKTGLWEVRIARDGDGQKMADAMQKLKTLPPEIRAQVEAQMKKQGITIDAAGVVSRMCMAKDSFDVEHMQNRAAASKCKTDFGARTAASWKWHAVCAEPPSESDGEAVFDSGGESYTMKVNSKLTLGGVPTTSHVTLNGKWLGAGCGELKPLAVQK